MLDLNKKIVLFDGVCNLCNTSVQYIIKHDKNDDFRFAPLQSDIGIKLAKERGIDTSNVDSIVLIRPGIAYYTKSSAAIEIMYGFGGVWKLMIIFKYTSPPFIRDLVYDFIARNRYKWFGKEDSCMIPSPELKSKFLG